jgi:dihydropyrimidinase
MMSDFDLLITNGTIVDPVAGVAQGDIAISSGRIAARLTPGSRVTARETIDATGLHVFPGLIDAHVHFGFGEPITEYTTETVYAAQGGFTSILGYFLSSEPYAEIFDGEHAHAAARSHVDFGFHFSVANERHIEEMGDYVARYGVTSFKYFMNFKGEEGRYLGLDGTDDGYFHALLERAAALGDVTIVVHTENIELVNRFRRASIVSGGNTLKDWNLSKPAITEAESTIRALYLAEKLGATIYIPHISTRMALDEVRRWRARYDRVTVETCPHYLTHDWDADLGSIGKANPPFRSPDDIAAMWEGLADGSIDVVASDHVPRKRATKEKPIWQASQGFPGTATILPVLLDQGYHRGRLSLQRIAQLLTSRPAEIFAMAGKGSLAPGADADVTLVDLAQERIVDPAALGSYSDYSLYEGQSFKGWPVRAILRGKTIRHDAAIVGEGGYGRYLGRAATRPTAPGLIGL